MSDSHRCGVRGFPVSRRQAIVGCLAACAASSLPGAGETGQAKDVAWLDEIQRPPRSIPGTAAKLAPLLQDEAGQPITTLAAWTRRREAIRRWWLEFLKPMPPLAGGPPKLTVRGEDRIEGVVRQLVEYEIEPGLTTQAYLLKPAAGGRGRGGVLAFHSTVAYSIRQPAGLEGPPEKFFGLNLARRGYVALCPRNFLWPENGRMAIKEQVADFQARRPGCKGMAKMLYDATVALDILAAQPEVDAGRLGVVGHSLGAKEALYLAALDGRVRVAVSSEGGVGVGFSNWDAAWYLGAEVREPSFTHDHHELLALIAPRPFLLMGGDSADGDRSWPLIEAALPVYRLYGGVPRIGLFNHHKGHNVSPEAESRIYEWLETYC